MEKKGVIVSNADYGSNKMKTENGPFNLAIRTSDFDKHCFSGVMVTNDWVEQVQRRMGGVEVERKCWQLQRVLLNGEERDEAVA